MTAENKQRTTTNTSVTCIMLDHKPMQGCRECNVDHDECFLLHTFRPLHGCIRRRVGPRPSLSPLSAPSQLKRWCDAVTQLLTILINCADRSLSVVCLLCAFASSFLTHHNSETATSKPKSASHRQRRPRERERFQDLLHCNVLTLLSSSLSPPLSLWIVPMALPRLFFFPKGPKSPR